MLGFTMEKEDAARRNVVVEITKVTKNGEIKRSC